MRLFGLNADLGFGDSWMFDGGVSYAAPQLAARSRFNLTAAEGDHAPGGWVLGAPDIVPGDTSTTATVAVGGYVEGAIDTAGDHDWYVVTLTAGQTYTFSTMFSTELGDSILTLRSSTGALIVQNDDANTSNGLYLSEITYTPTSSGNFYLDVSGYQSDTGTYYLSVTRPMADSVAGSTATTGTVAIGGSVNGTLENTGDHDWYAVTLTAGQTYLFTTSATGAAGDIDTALFLRDAVGSLLAYNDDSNGTYSRIRFTATTSGTYYIDLGGWGDDASGGYRLQAEIAPPLSLYTNDQIATQLTHTYWGGSSRHFNVQPGGTITVNLTQLTADGQFLAREALNLWSDVLGVTFNEVASGGQMQFDDNQDGAFTSSSTSGGIITSATVNVSTAWLTQSGTTLRSYSFQTYVHEIGHALGLGHGGPYNTTANYGQDATYLNDAWATTIMSYFDQTENTYFGGLGFSRVYAQTPMVADIIAARNLYGGGASNTRTGNTTYGFNNNSGREIYSAAVGQTSIAVTIVDNGGTDTLNYSGFASNQRIDLNQESFSNIGGGVGNLSIARGTIIENAMGGSGNDVLIGNAASNRLDGGAGVDSMYGGAGDDTFVVNQQTELVFENAGEGNDRVESSSSFYLYANVENLTLTGAGDFFGVGNDLDNMIYGNDGQNLLIGGLGNDTFYGGGARDSIFGESGNDWLSGDAGIDYLVGGDGHDVILGGDGADEMYGQDGSDTLNGGNTFDTDIMVGGAGSDYLYGNSGLGDYDLMYGNEDDDLYYVDTPADLVFEQAGEGIDWVIADIDGAGYYLYANIEKLTLQGTTPFGVGNDLDNIMTGSDSANWLLGGLGDDTLNGMLGDDVLFGEAGGDTFIFEQGTGSDIVGDFTRGQDKIDLSSYGLTFTQLQGLFVQNGNVGAIQMTNGDVIVLHNVTMSQLEASDFILGATAEPAKAAPTMEPQPFVSANPLAADTPYGVEGIVGGGLAHWDSAPNQGWLLG
ncbi:M10 family metallopeptidase C-terminal domain-containing protein [Novosphingobium sp.]|uniref:M10 family metallopeptidase C-terminal domain-containing protein n=1 Tax=Novosphingobium sp. TaxID=1874826 RepID=UPI0025DE7FE7|nr:M10 family metallopeptidase C-terminal domain-containing protein [Novosphingobium sp.]MCC6926188.1 M10 family metallopeptidase C-terminal domain-containing protein [Novosphingobium sp.]